MTAPTLIVEGLRAAVDGQEILEGVDLEIPAGEVHVLMGPSGSGKSTLAHVIAGRPGYEVLAGSVRIDDVELLSLPTWQRAEAGLFLAMQDPIEVPGVALRDVLAGSVRTPSDPAEVGDRVRGEAERIGFGTQLLDRPFNVGLSGGESKRSETLQLGVLRPAFAILDEFDAGLDNEGLRVVGQRVEEATNEDGLGVLVITHSTRLFEQLALDTVHVFVDGKIRESGGPALVAELEAAGYERWADPSAGPQADAGDDPAAEAPA